MSTDSKNHLQQYQEDNNLRFPQISDRGARVAREFDVDVFDKGAGKEIKFKQAIPSKFLIDKSSIIIWNYIAKTKTERPDIKIIIKEIEKRV